MNISTGGPHVLLFERDQQFAALLSSELQLAGYECHMARTAVEVFDAIARYSIRLVLVNLAQAAAGRREFWVALDTQRRGRGVQVLTFHCSNLAGYGPTSDDPDDHSHIMLADLEVDGMPGIMNMVNAIRSRIAVSSGGTLSRPASNPGVDARQQGSIATSEGSKVAQTTMPLPAASPGNGISFSGRGNSSSQPAAPNSANSPSQPPLSSATEAAPPSPAPGVNHTDKIHAVIYPNQRLWNTQRDSDLDSDGPNNLNSVSSQNSVPVNSISPPPLPPFSEGETRNESPSWQPRNQPEQKESGLAQLSRMVQERHAPLAPPADTTFPTNNAQNTTPISEATMPQQRVRPSDAAAIGAQPLRVSPIEDLPNDRNVGNARNTRADSGMTAIRPDGSGQGSTYQNNSPHQPTSTLASITMPVASSPAAAVSPSIQEKVASSPDQRDSEPVPLPPLADDSGGGAEAQLTQLQSMLRKQTQQQSAEVEKRQSPGGDDSTMRNLMSAQSQPPSGAVAVKSAADNALLFDIVQSLPSMPSPPPQQMLSGRATRSLGSVLLEGHLVPQDRLEVALGIQRMLRGVDMNYQLGEILLMFKLLTPDQLLAASLVSYGLITTTQISALGRIRQELHSIGLEYDLENLLILFRILTSEQLREVRSAWSS